MHAGPVKKRVQRTTYNEKGEEVTEMVSEDEEPEQSAAKIDKQVSSPYVGSTALLSDKQEPATCVQQMTTDSCWWCHTGVSLLRSSP